MVFEDDGTVKDVIVRLSNAEYAKCWRKQKSTSQSSLHTVEGSNGYQCGHKFIPDNKIQESLIAAGENLDKGNYYPSKVTEDIVNKFYGSMIWPIYGARRSDLVSKSISSLIIFTYTEIISC